MAKVWGTILHRFNIASKKLQCTDINTSIVIELYTSLILFVKNSHDMFAFFEKTATEKSGLSNYATSNKWQKRTLE
jgi:hypothetical protein